MRLQKIFLGLAITATLGYAQFIGITPAELQTKIDQKVVVIDIRTPGEWKDTGVIPTSHKIMFFDNSGKYDMKAWLNDISKYVKTKTQPFVLVCRSGNRTGQVGQFLSDKLGYKKVFDLDHGIKSWIKEQRKTIK